MKVDFLATYIMSEMHINLPIYLQLTGTLNASGFSCTNLVCINQNYVGSHLRKHFLKASIYVCLALC